MLRMGLLWRGTCNRPAGQRNSMDAGQGAVGKRQLCCTRTSGQALARYEQRLPASVGACDVGATAARSLRVQHNSLFSDGAHSLGVLYLCPYMGSRGRGRAGNARNGLPGGSPLGPEAAGRGSAGQFAGHGCPVVRIPNHAQPLPGRRRRRHNIPPQTRQNHPLRYRRRPRRGAQRRER